MRWPWPQKREQDLERELCCHLDLESAEQQQNGLTPEDARYAAQRVLGNTTLVKEEVRESWGWASAERFEQDVRFATRLLRRSPGFAAVAILTLAMGIGANTAIFSITDAVLLRRLPYPDPNRLIRVWQSEPKMGEGHLGTAPPEFVAYRERSRAFSSIAGYQRESFDVTSEAVPEHIAGCRATASLFQTLGVRPLTGRTFTPDEELSGAAKVVVLSYQYWRRHYAEDPHIVGKFIRLNEELYQIIGVMPESFTFPSTAATPGEPPALWLPLSFTGQELTDWASSFDTSIVARLRDGVSLLQARNDVKRVAAEFQQEHPNIYSGNIRLEATAEPWSPDFGARIPVVLSMLCTAVGFVLIIACVNVANLLLARAGARQREISIRRALGASSARLMRQVLTETAILTIPGGVLGCLLAYGLLRAAATLSTNEVNIAAASIDVRVLMFTLGLSSVTCLLCGIAPAWTLRRSDVNGSLKQSARQSGLNRSRRRISRFLILAEVGCSVVLLIGSGLLLRSFVHILQVPLGFDPEHALVVRTTFNRQRYTSPDRRHAVERTIQTRLSSLPGASAVAVTTHVPLADERQIGFVIDGRPPDEFHWADNALVSGNYFHVMRISLLSGRTFSDLDTPQAPFAAVINQSMARQYWPEEDPIGKGFQWGGRHLRVVGVVGDVHVEALDKPVASTVYNSVYQIESGASTSAIFEIRTRGEDPMLLARPAGNVIWSLDRGLPILGFSTLHQVVSASLAIRRASLVLAGSFALLAMVLSLIGVYGVLSHAVIQRTQEMGVRLALGARPVEITALIVGEGVRLTAWGVLLGVAGGAIAGTLISKLLFRVPVLDAVSFSAGALLFLAVSLLASYFPARRASRVDPIVALRCE
jgi:predicted permease